MPGFALPDGQVGKQLRSGFRPPAKATAPLLGSSPCSLPINKKKRCFIYRADLCASYTDNKFLGLNVF
jgi:hypothetical protein